MSSVAVMIGTLRVKSFSTVFQSYQGDERLVMKCSVHEVPPGTDEVLPPADLNLCP